MSTREKIKSPKSERRIYISKALSFLVCSSSNTKNKPMFEGVESFSFPGTYDS